MSKSINSPTSRLLQSSRLFSLPRPLPQPALDNATSTGIYRASDSATLPYPTHQAVATPASSHFRGDWGLKRPLPAKATRSTSTPHIRVYQQDNAAHITDFGSAADHTQTLAKWQQMGVPLIATRDKKKFTDSRRTTRSVYDDDLDNTSSKQSSRWKYAGPWLPGMQGGDFELWLMARIAKRKDEFRDFLQERMLRRRIQEEQKMLRDAGEARAISELRRVQLRKEIEDNFEAEEKRMRDDHVSNHLSSDLTAAICDFLDLPGVRVEKAEYSNMAQTSQLRTTLGGIVGSEGPPSTHPAAGLSHVRTNAFLENHPLWGPQAQRSPVLSRVVRPRNAASGNENQAKLGVGGFVTDDPISQSYSEKTAAGFPEPISDIYKDTNRMVNMIEPDLEGGNKVWVQPQSAHVDEKGRIRLHVNRGDREAIAVAENNVEHIHEARNASRRGFYPAPGTAGNANFGAALGPQSAYPQTFTRGTERAPALDREQEGLARIRELATGHRGVPSGRGGAV